MAGQISQGLVSGAMTRSEFVEQDSTESYFENYTERVQTRIVNLLTDTQQADGTSLIWGNTTYGIWGSFLWSTGFTTPIVRVREQFLWRDYDENFLTTTYEDTVNTTATGWGTGTVIFISGTGSLVFDFTTGSATASIDASTGSIQLT
jgi:hypothetical protein